MLNLAHLSDPHLGPLPTARLSELFTKRITGYLSWKLKRHAIHKPEITSALVSDITASPAEITAVTGDLVNIALPDEFTRARDWLEKLGPPEKIAVIPGNHDSYVHVDDKIGQGLWAPYMRGEAAVPGRAEGEIFPYIRHYRNVALIGTSSSIKTLPFQASGALGETQLEVLANSLERLREQGFYRVLMIHHPPLPGQATPRKALKDAQALQNVLKTSGCELVLHGHNHMHMHTELQSSHGPVNVFGVPSASACATDHKPAAAWNLYEIKRKDGNWQCTVRIRGYDETTGNFLEIKKLVL